MRNLFVLLGVFLFICGAAGAAHAVSYTDVYDAGHVLMRGPSIFASNQIVSWTFDITEHGFDPTQQDVTAASITLNLTDDRDCWFFWWEYARLDIGVNEFFWEVDSGDVAFEIKSLMTLSESGTVDAVLTAASGDFYFNSATLVAEATEVMSPGATPVPEPANILLLGAGLIGLSGFMRKSKNWLGPNSKLRKGK